MSWSTINKSIDGSLGSPRHPGAKTPRTQHRWQRALAFLAFAHLASTLPAFAGGSGAVPTEIPKDRIPSYFLVLHFFESTVRYEAETPYAYEDRLEALGLERGTDGERALAVAAREATAILAMPSTDPALLDSEEEFQAFQEKALREKARGLAEVYGGLLADLEAAGLDPGRLPEYLDQVIRPDVSLWVEVTPEQDPVAVFLGDENVQAALAFDEMAQAYYRNGGS